MLRNELIAVTELSHSHSSVKPVLGHMVEMFTFEYFQSSHMIMLWCIINYRVVFFAT